MRADTHAPAKVLDGVVNTFLAGMADALHRVPGDGANTRGLVTGAHVHGIGRVSKVEAAGKRALLQRPDLVAGWHRQAQTSGRHGIRNRLEGERRVAKGK